MTHPSPTRLVTITATTNLKKAWDCLSSWGTGPIVVVNQGTAFKSNEVPSHLFIIQHDEYLGTVPAFRVGVDYVLRNLPEVEFLACLHDDVIVKDPIWVEKVEKGFDRRPACGLLGFGGAIGVGAEDIYQVPYQPVQLARVGFRSNMDDAEVHGMRSLLPERVACLDGFSQIGRREFFRGDTPPRHHPEGTTWVRKERPWTYLQDLGIVHHSYDGMLGCYAARLGWETWYLPIRCRHLGGQTAVGDAGYQSWAKGQILGGDQGFWKHSHHVWYDSFTDVLPLRV